MGTRGSASPAWAPTWRLSRTRLSPQAVSHTVTLHPERRCVQVGRRPKPPGCSASCPLGLLGVTCGYTLPGTMVPREGKRGVCVRRAGTQAALGTRCSLCLEYSLPHPENFLHSVRLGSDATLRSLPRVLKRALPSGRNLCRPARLCLCPAGDRQPAMSMCSQEELPLRCSGRGSGGGRWAWLTAQKSSQKRSLGLTGLCTPVPSFWPQTGFRQHLNE